MSGLAGGPIVIGVLGGFGPDYLAQSDMPALQAMARAGRTKTIAGCMPAVTNVNISHGSRHELAVPLVACGPRVEWSAWDRCAHNLDLIRLLGLEEAGTAAKARPAGRKEAHLPCEEADENAGVSISRP